MIKHYTLKALQTAINHALALDPTCFEKMRDIDGKIVEIQIAPLGSHFYIRFSTTGLTLLATYENQPDTVIRSSPIGLIRLSLLPASKVRSLFNESIQISGDVMLGQAVKKLFDELDIDWEGHLAQFTGDMVAYQVGSFVRRGLNFQRQVGQSIRDNLTEYLQEECRAFPPREEMDDFFNDIDALALQVERLIAQVNLLEQHENH